MYYLLQTKKTFSNRHVQIIEVRGGDGHKITKVIMVEIRGGQIEWKGGGRTNLIKIYLVRGGRTQNVTHRHTHTHTCSFLILILYIRGDGHK